MNNKLLVPIDFQNSTLNALNYALKLSASGNFDISVLHLLNNESDRITAKSKLEQLLAQVSIPDGTVIEQHILVGKIESDIGKTAETIKADFIVMGTHGASGLEKVFGSKAISVISESKVPFLVIQEGAEFKDSNTIAMTIDLEKESIQVVKAAAQLAKEYNSKIIMVGGDHTDPVLKKKVDINIKIARKTLATQGIESAVELLPRDHFMDHLIDYCVKNNVNMLAATYYSDTFSIFSKKFVQKLLNNEAHIPVLTLDGESISVGTQYSFISV